MEVLGLTESDLEGLVCGPWVRVGVVGPARNYGDLGTRDLFEAMVQVVGGFLVSLDRPIHLVSGGAAWGDHVAVSLFLEPTYPVCSLDLELPCPFRNRYVETTGSWQTNPGKLANALHRDFSSKVGFDSLRQIEQATQDERCNVCVSNGFHARNAKIAEVDLLLAFAFGEPSGGTLNTWEQARNKRALIDLTRFEGSF